ncbi:hydroxymethylglutaryl-CoA synthase [Jimgerdemannia flammicorona]|uniref:Hydroxymethylglutaryl-CoA synthase n=1 Tax=Jimgerdemannia flammicorona TaxID=994334 RepID=A0A433QZ53_9FUNG|nr:hydroxymethylglutaryl-CoA synthase [Jimgerdemannia flammicorona]
MVLSLSSFCLCSPQYVEQSALEKFDGVSEGKYTIGLGQKKMAFVDDREDIQSVCLTAVTKLHEKYKISFNDIGRLEVGTETIIDKSKSVKSTLMQLFSKHGNTEIEGVDTTNACYGGTNAFFNAVNWIESSSWDGRYAIVVAGDFAIYAQGSARPTSGAGVVAMLIGKDAPIVIERGLRSTHMEHAWDFYKPDLSSEYPTVDGKLSGICYLRAFDKCYNRYMKRLGDIDNVQHPGVDNIDYFVFHSPYTKLVQKTYARALYNDFIRNAEDPRWADYAHHRVLSYEEALLSRDVEKTFVTHAKAGYAQKVEPGLLAAKQIGNMYTASVWTCLATVISEVSSEDLQNKRVVLFSYGSGLASSMLSFRIVGSITHIAKHLSIRERLDSRVLCTPQDFEIALNLRELTHSTKDYIPTGSLEHINDGDFYLEKVDHMFRRTYLRKD